MSRHEQRDRAQAAKRRHGIVALSLAAFVAGMVGLSFAAVPLYRMFCQATGYGGIPQRADRRRDKVLDRTIRIRFDGNVARAALELRARCSRPWT